VAEVGAEAVMAVRFIRRGMLYAVVAADCGTWLAGLLTEANRAEHVARNGWRVVG